MAEKSLFMGHFLCTLSSPSHSHFPHNHLHHHPNRATPIKSLSSSPSLMATSSESSAPSACSSSSPPPSLLVFSGGTAFNGVVEGLKKLTTRVTHVLPVSDDGGSTAEIVRVLGGPAVGDIRSRCLRLADQRTAEALAVKRLLGHRLPVQSSEAKSEWYDIVEGEHPLWEEVSIPYRETIRAFLVFFQHQILMRAQEKFCFSNGSIGNFFFAGARIFFQSLEAAIFLFSRVSDIPKESLVLPVISTNDRLTLGCELWDGRIIRGQNEISHPTNGSELINKNIPKMLVNYWDEVRGIILNPRSRMCKLKIGQGISHCGDAKNLKALCKTSVQALPSRIKRVFYMSSEGCNLLHEVYPTPNPAVLDQLRSVDCIVYAMGSLFTSICPSLVLNGIGETISSRDCPKILLLNGTHDRETTGFSASSFVTAITDALNRTYGNPRNHLTNPPNKYTNTIFVPRNGEIPVDRDALEDQGIHEVITIESINDPKVGIIFDPKSLIQTLADFLKMKSLHEGK